MSVQLHLGDCVEVMRGLDENSVDTCITDPPYGLGFMGKEWDTFDKSQFGIAGNEGANDLKVKKNFNILPRYGSSKNLYNFTLEWASEVYRVLKPGALLLAFGGTRTYHRLVCGIEDAGFEIRDTIGWVYGSGFPKSHDISKAIEAKMQTGKSSPLAQRKTSMGNDYQPSPLAGTPSYGVTGNFVNKDTGSKPMNISTPEAQLWDGWGTALKPAMELIVVAQKPIDGTYAENALKWGVAGYWIDGGRVGYSANEPDGRVGTDFVSNGGDASNNANDNQVPNKHYVQLYKSEGRFPANFIHDGSDEVVELFPDNAGAYAPVKKGQKPWGGKIYGNFAEGGDDGASFYGDGLGSAARFFYCAKASRNERNAGLELNKQNHHPTVKPISLMRYLVRLTKTPTGGVVVDPFMGSGTTGCACALEWRDFIGIEREADYFEIAEKRIAHWALQPTLQE